MKVVLISTYELGRQPFGLASPAAWLRQAGFEVAAFDVSRQPLETAALGSAALIAFYLPMHTATRLALRLLPQVQAAAPGAHLCAYGLYAPINRAHLHRAGVSTVLGGEFEGALTGLAQRLARGEPAATSEETGPVPRLDFLAPDRRGLPPLARYARLSFPDGSQRVAGYTEASRGCKHRCRHCPIVPVYQGQFRVVAPEVVLADIRQQVAAGAAHISFGDPDFFNGPAHAMRVVEGLHREFPELSYDVTIKVEHLLRQERLLERLGATGCALITTAVESFDDDVLQRLEKGHRRADFFAALARTREVGLALNPTFVSFTPWTTRASLKELFGLLAAHGLEPQVAPVQFGIRLLIPQGSRVLELADAPLWLGDFDAAALSFRWRHPEPEMDELCRQVQAVVGQGCERQLARAEIFAQVAALVGVTAGRAADGKHPRVAVPQLSEPWFCCAEPTEEQFARMMV